MREFKYVYRESRTAKNLALEFSVHARLGLVAGLVVFRKALILLAALAADSWKLDAAAHAVLEF